MCPHQFSVSAFAGLLYSRFAQTTVAVDWSKQKSYGKFRCEIGTARWSELLRTLTPLLNVSFSPCNINAILKKRYAFPMPRSKYRACRLLFYAWLFPVALWALLPSSSIPYVQEQRHIKSVLETSNTLISVDSYPTVFNRTDTSGSYIFEWRLLRHVTSKNEMELSLELSEKASINLADLIRRSEAFHFSKIKHSAIRTPFFDPKALNVAIPWVDYMESSDVCLPWFDRADKVLFTHALHRNMRKVSLRLTVDERKVVEIWPASYVEHTLAELNKIRKKPEAAEYEEGQLIEEALQFLKESCHPIIQLEGGDMTKPEDFVVPYVRGNLPSKTYHIRKQLLARLGVTISIALIPLTVAIRLFSVLPQVILFLLIQGGLACGGITLSAWLRAGRPPFRQWCRTFGITRWMFFRSNKAKTVWGPAGPVASKRADRSQWAGNEAAGLQRPKTVRLGRDLDAV